MPPPAAAAATPTLPMSSRYPIPQELKLEAYERRKHDAELDNLTLTLNLIPGHAGVGAICQGFIDAISKHDEAVKVSTVSASVSVSLSPMRAYPCISFTY